jgi:hypothetical protein
MKNAQVTNEPILVTFDRIGTRLSVKWISLIVTSAAFAGVDKQDLLTANITFICPCQITKLSTINWF